MNIADILGSNHLSTPILLKERWLQKRHLRVIIDD